MTKEEILLGIKRLEPWFHCIDLGDGIHTKTQSAIGEPVEHPEPTWKAVQVCLPDDLSGKSVLDVGCNAGFYSIEMKRRGAARVLGVDSQRNLIRQAQFVRKVLNLDIEYRRLSVYDLGQPTPRPFLARMVRHLRALIRRPSPTPDFEQFDITLALGLIYHCKHLVLALEKLFVVTRKLLVLETAIYPPERVPESFVYAEGGGEQTLHPMAYIENQTEAKEAVYNWFVPGTAALCALLRNVGFDEVRVFPGVQADRAVLACRKHQDYPDSRSISFLGSKLTLVKGPLRCRPNEVLHFTVRAENSGHARWLRGRESDRKQGDVHLAAHVLDTHEEPLSWYHAGAFLPGDVAPGEAVEIDIDVRAPEQPGNYILMFDMVSEHLAWFEDLGSETVKQSLEVV